MSFTFNYIESEFINNTGNSKFTPTSDEESPTLHFQRRTHIELISVAFIEHKYITINGLSPQPSTLNLHIIFLNGIRIENS